MGSILVVELFGLVYFDDWAVHFPGSRAMSLSAGWLQVSIPGFTHTSRIVDWEILPTNQGVPPQRNWRGKHHLWPVPTHQSLSTWAFFVLETREGGYVNLLRMAMEVSREDQIERNSSWWGAFPSGWPVIIIRSTGGDFSLEIYYIIYCFRCCDCDIV